MPTKNNTARKLRSAGIMIEAEVLPNDPTVDKVGIKGKKQKADLTPVVVKQHALGRSNVEISRDTGLSIKQVSEIMARARVDMKMGKGALKSEVMKVALVATDMAGQALEELTPMQKVHAARIFISSVKDMEEVHPETAANQEIDFDTLKQVGNSLLEIKTKINEGSN